MVTFLKSRYDLQMYHIDARPVHSFFRTEIMRHAASKPRVGIIILNHVSYIFYTMFPAPFADLQRKILRQQYGNAIHIIPSQRRCLLSCLIPERNQSCRKAFSPSFLQHLFQLSAPRQSHIFSSKFFFKSVSWYIAKLRFIRKKTGKGCAKILFVPLIMRLIHLIQKNPHGFFVDQIHIIIPATTFSRCKQHEQTVISIRNIQIYDSPMQFICQIYRLCNSNIRVLSIRLRTRINAQ